MKKRWSNVPCNPTNDILKKIHSMKEEGLSYREISKRIGRDHVTVRRYYLKWLKRRNCFFRFVDWLKGRKNDVTFDYLVVGIAMWIITGIIILGEGKK